VLEEVSGKVVALLDEFRNIVSADQPDRLALIEVKSGLRLGSCTILRAAGWRLSVAIHK
jgi:hypothetical protein